MSRNGKRLPNHKSQKPRKVVGSLHPEWGLNIHDPTVNFDHMFQSSDSLFFQSLNPLSVVVPRSSSFTFRYFDLLGLFLIRFSILLFVYLNYSFLVPVDHVKRHRGMSNVSRKVNLELCVFKLNGGGEVLHCLFFLIPFLFSPNSLINITGTIQDRRCHPRNVRTRGT